jgi:hypothetical protein
MKTTEWIKTALLLALAAFGPRAIAAEAVDASGAWDGLVEIKAKRMDAAYLLPGADFRPYAKVILDPTQVAFRKNWMKDVNQSTPGVSRDVTEADAEKIAEAARGNFGDVFTEAFTKGGYQVVTAPAPDVLKLSTAVVNLYINAPDTMSAGRTRTYTMEAGEATLILEARDSTTGALLGRVLDRRQTRDSGTMSVSSSVTNLSDFRALFRRWADTCVKGLGELKEQSPVPDNLTPKQKL